MSDEIAVRAWKDPAYRATLAPSELAALPPNPAGIVEIDDAELGAAAGGSTERLLTLGCCGGFTTDPGGCTFFCLPPSTGPTYRATAASSSGVSTMEEAYCP